MVKLRSTRKKVRDKRRLLAFLIRERCRDKDVRLDYWQLCVQLRKLVNISEGDVDLKKHPEQRKTFWQFLAGFQQGSGGSEDQADDRLGQRWRSGEPNFDQGPESSC